MLPVLVEQQHGQEAGAGPSTRGDMERRRRLRDLLAVPAGELLAHRLDDLPRARDHFERLGHILAELGQPVATARWARARRGNDDTFAREVIGKRLPDRLLALECGNGRRLRRGGLGSQLVLGRVGFEILKHELVLCEQPLGAFGAGAVLLASQLGVLQLEMRDHRFGGARQSAGVGQLGLDGCGVLLGLVDLLKRLDQQRLERIGVIRKGRNGGFHGQSESSSAPRIKPKMRRLYRLTGALWPPRILRVAPIDTIEQASELRARKRHHAVLGGGPNELPAFEPLRVNRHARAK